MAPLVITQVGLEALDAQGLIQELNAELSRTYPEEGANHFRLSAEEVAPGRGAFLVARRDGIAVGCGAVRLVSPDTAELKRMFTVPQERGRGTGRALLLALEDLARKLGARRFVLETGTRQTAAINLYARNGFSHVEPFGEYVGSPLSYCMAKAL